MGVRAALTSGGECRRHEPTSQLCRLRYVEVSAHLPSRRPPIQNSNVLPVVKVAGYVLEPHALVLPAGAVRAFRSGRHRDGSEVALDVAADPCLGHSAHAAPSSGSKSRRVVSAADAISFSSSRSLLKPRA